MSISVLIGVLVTIGVILGLSIYSGTKITAVGQGNGAAVTAGTGNRPAWVSEDVANVMASVEGFPADENSKAALLPSMVSIELPGHPKASEINTILSEEHSAIITREIDIEEGILNMNDRVAEVLAQ